MKLKLIFYGVHQYGRYTSEKPYNFYFNCILFYFIDLGLENFREHYKIMKSYVQWAPLNDIKADNEINRFIEN